MGGENNILLIFYFFAGETLSQVQSTNNWYNLTYNLILNESTLSLTCFSQHQVWVLISEACLTRLN